MDGRRVTMCFKLMGSFVALLVMLVALSLCALQGIRSLGGSLDTAVNSTARKMEMAAAIHGGVHEMRVHASLAEISLLNTMIKSVAGGSGEDAGCSACHTPDRVDANRDAFLAKAAKLSQQVAAMRPLVHSATERTSLDAIQGGISNWGRLYSQYLDLAAHKNFSLAHDTMVNQIYPVLPKIVEAADSLTAEQQRLLAESRTAADRQVSLSFWEVGLAVAFGLIAGIGGLWVVRQVAGSLRQGTRRLLEMSRQVASAAEQIAESNHSLAQGVSEQAASLEETSAATTEVSSMTQKNASGTRDIAGLINGDAGLVADANCKLDAMLASMREIVVSGGKISKIVKTIDGLAFQTNLLALNASVEAARAGESGLGFAVVAQEVRALAQRSADAARDTAELVAASVDAGNTGRAQLDSVVVVIASITERTLKVKGLMDQVNHTGQEQAQGLAQIARAMAQMDQVTTATAANAEQRAAASEQLSAQSQAMHDVIAELQAIV
jgi:methyl-accepting chemotaxis protein/methyl-accepting chemotaxis protein-1 (serine sensor receptor)